MGLFGLFENKKTEQNTSNSTTNQTNMTDQSYQMGDGSIGLNGSGNIIDQSAVNTDYSNRSTNFNDESDRSTNFTDNSVKTVTDFGSIQNALDSMRATSQASINSTGGMLNSTIGALMSMSSANANAISSAFEFAKGSEVNSGKTAAAAMGFANSAIDKANDAFNKANTPADNENIKILAMAIVGIAVAVFAFKN